MSFLNLFKFKIDCNYALLIIDIIKKKRIIQLIETDKIFKKIKFSNMDDTLYHKLDIKFKNNDNIKIISEFDDMIINFKNPSFGFSIRIKKIFDYIKTELLINKMLCYSEELGYNEPYHIHYSIESVVYDIYSVFEKILKFRKSDLKWIKFTLILENNKTLLE
jgi:hypothetical protein